MDLTYWHYLAFIVLGMFAGIINVLAGGGSNLVLPLLMVFGIPPDIANGSNRVGIFFQSLTAIRSFKKTGYLPVADLHAILLPMILGGLFGSLLASVLPQSMIKPALLFTMSGVALWTFFKPNLLLIPEYAVVKKVSCTPWAYPLLFAVGMYGGFVQAGVGLLMLPLFAGLLNYDLIRANALKLVCTLAFTSVSLAVFVGYGKIWWSVGLVLAVGNVIGALVGVRVTLQLPPNIMRWIVLLMVLVTVVLAWLK